MTPPIATVVRVAATPAEAKVIVARLAAEGIPAHIDGDSLSDEVAVSRRLMVMACAVGGCAGCAVPVVTDAGLAMKRVCVDGPVFDAAAVFPPAA